MMQSLFLPCLYAFLASAAFAILFNVHHFGIVVCGMGGTIGWLVYLLAAPYFQSPIMQSFFAALAISAYSEIMSRVRKCPVTGYLIIAFFPLVPGGGIYYTMRYCMAGNKEMFYAKAMETFGIAGALALGVLIVSSIFRLVISYRNQAKRSSRP